MKYLIHCSKCEYVDGRNYITNSQCPCCLAPLIIDDEVEDDNIAKDIEREEGDIIDHIGTGNSTKKDFTIEEILEMDAINKMEESIKDLGHSRTWLAIESIVNPLHRVKMRMNFFKTGGKIP